MRLCGVAACVRVRASSTNTKIDRNGRMVAVIGGSVKTQTRINTPRARRIEILAAILLVGNTYADQQASAHPQRKVLKRQRITALRKLRSTPRRSYRRPR